MAQNGGWPVRSAWCACRSAELIPRRVLLHGGNPDVSDGVGWPNAGGGIELLLRGDDGCFRLSNRAEPVFKLDGDQGRLGVRLLPVADHLVVSDAEGAGGDPDRVRGDIRLRASETDRIHVEICIAGSGIDTAGLSVPVLRGIRDSHRGGRIPTDAAVREVGIVGQWGDSDSRAGDSDCRVIGDAGAESGAARGVRHRADPEIQKGRGEGPGIWGYDFVRHADEHGIRDGDAGRGGASDAGTVSMAAGRRELEDGDDSAGDRGLVVALLRWADTRGVECDQDEVLAGIADAGLHRGAGAALQHDVRECGAGLSSAGTVAAVAADLCGLRAGDEAIEEADEAEAAGSAGSAGIHACRNV